MQECPEALNTLKYFQERKRTTYHVVAAGSLLGTLLAQPKSYPGGDGQSARPVPADLRRVSGSHRTGALCTYYESIQKDQAIEEIFHNRLLEAYNYYLIIGVDAGMRCILGQP